MTTLVLSEAEVPTEQAKTGSIHHPSHLLRLRSTDTAHWAYVGTLIARMHQFSLAHHLEADPVTVSRYITSLWATGGETVALWVACTEEGTVCGHTVATLEQFWGVPYGMVMQAELDHPYIMTAAQVREMMSELSTWAKAQGGTSLKQLTPRNPEAWLAHSGFQFDKTLLKLPL